MVEPEIPANTGNVARTCAATGARLHLVKPLGFSVSDKHLKRAGLDYWDLLDITYYENLDDFLEKTKGGKYYFFSTKALNRHTDAKYEDNCYLVFGKDLLQAFPVSNIHLVERHLFAAELFHPGKRLRAGIAEVVHHHSAVACRQQLHKCMRANISGSACNKYVH